MADEKTDFLSELEAQEDGDGSAPSAEKEGGELNQDGSGAEPKEEGESVEELKRQVIGLTKAAEAERKKRQALEDEMSSVRISMRELETIKQQAKEMEESGALAPGVSEQDLTPEQRENRRLYSELVARVTQDVKKTVDADRAKDREDRLDFALDRAMSSFQSDYNLSEERLDEVLDYLEKQGISVDDPLKVDRVYALLENAYFAMAGRKVFAKRQAAPSGAVNKEDAAKIVGAPQGTPSQTLVTPYDPEKDAGKPLSVLVDEAVAEARSKGAKV